MQPTSDCVPAAFIVINVKHDNDYVADNNDGDDYDDVCDGDGCS